MLENIKNKFGLSSFQLKLIAIITMFIDHTGAIMLRGTNYYTEARVIGRIAFPIFCFLITEGFEKTRDVKKYAIRLGIFALISELPFNLLAVNKLFSFERQNVFFTLLLGLGLIYWYTYFSVKNQLAAAFAGIPLFMGAAYVLHTDYSWWGVMLIFIFYAFKNNKLLMSVLICAAMILHGGTEIYGMAALIPILLYNGKKGHSMKYFFYVFYPVHILLLWFARYLIMYYN